jgi:hypothetical protein
VTEQRKNKRFGLRLPLELIKNGKRRVSERGETRNVSSGGVLFTAGTEIQVGEVIEYLISLPSGEGTRLRCMGKVVRASPEPGDKLEPGQKVSVAATLERYQFVRDN